MFFETFFANTISHVNVYIIFILLLDLPSTNLTKAIYFFLVSPIRNDLSEELGTNIQQTLIVKVCPTHNTSWP